MPPSIQYPFAFDEQGMLVSVNGIQRECRYEHTYTCPECGRALLPRLGEKRTKHFYHSDGQPCGVESYLHRVAKLIFETRFKKRDKPFVIRLKQSTLCAEHSTCLRYRPVYCHYKKEYTENLLDEYDLPAIVEPTIQSEDGIFRPDVCIQSSNPNKDDIFLEVWYKHRSSEKKIASGKRIIEFHINNEEDLLSLQTRENFIESENIVFYNFEGTASAQHIKDIGWLKNPSCPFLFGRIEPKELSGRSEPKEYANFTRDSNLPRLCSNCEHHADYYDGAEWCTLDLDISTRKGTYDNTIAERCDSFRPVAHLETKEENSDSHQQDDNRKPL